MTHAPVSDQPSSSLLAEGAALLAAIIRTCSEEAALVGKQELHEVYLEAWPRRQALTAPQDPLPGSLDAASSGASDSDTAPEGKAEAGTPVVPVPLSRRQLFAALFGRGGQEEVDDAAPGAATGASHEAPSGTPEVPAAAGDPDATGPDPLSPDPLPPDFAAALEAALAEHADLAVVVCNGEPAYHSLPRLSATYAAILAQQDNPVSQMAHTVRHSSQTYPRPVPVDMFEYPPFAFSPEQIQACLQAMGADAQWQDIRFVESSAGTVYLYSTQYLDHGYAEFLAERQDVGMLMNP